MCGETDIDLERFRNSSDCAFSGKVCFFLNEAELFLKTFVNIGWRRLDV
jgi:hypothetical protein